ncbi:cell division protein FtsK [Lactobacillus panisapium]|uniref:cell division protein FtsK n=1 Tax=Lactobacillus panisapium TaxID=2012495 RepID=UPI001C6A50E7|nr:cell division protein FtsK [Lactobacillus panisapium]QYN55651.1 cell division protein FtsK [Lactobacillus panisapium]
MMKKDKAKFKKLTLDTKKPLGNPIGLKVETFATLIIIIGVEGQLVFRHIVNYKNLYGLLYPFLLLIIPLSCPTWKWIKWHFLNREVYNILIQIIRSENLIDYSENKEQRDPFNQRKVIAGVKIVYEEKNNEICLTFYPRGIKNNNAVKTLSQRLEELFNLSVSGVDNQRTYTKYLMSDVSAQSYSVTDYDF